VCFGALRPVRCCGASEDIPEAPFSFCQGPDLRTGSRALGEGEVPRTELLRCQAPAFD
jgi:hypothetical protein